TCTAWVARFPRNFQYRAAAETRGSGDLERHQTEIDPGDVHREGRQFVALYVQSASSLEIPKRPRMRSRSSWLANSTLSLPLRLPTEMFTLVSRRSPNRSATAKNSGAFFVVARETLIESPRLSRTTASSEALSDSPSATMRCARTSICSGS